MSVAANNVVLNDPGTLNLTGNVSVASLVLNGSTQPVAINENGWTLTVGGVAGAAVAPILTAGTQNATINGAGGTGVGQNNGDGVLNMAAASAISAVTNTASPTITTGTPHGLLPGEMVSISGTNLPTLNGQFQVLTAPTPTTFTITLAAPGVYTSGGVVNALVSTITGITNTVNPTITTSTNHGLVAGQTVTLAGIVANSFYAITGVVNAANPTITTGTNHGLVVGQTVTIAGVLGATGVNGTWVVTAVTANTFTFDAFAPAAWIACSPDPAW